MATENTWRADIERRVTSIESELAEIPSVIGKRFERRQIANAAAVQALMLEPDPTVRNALLDRLEPAELKRHLLDASASRTAVVVAQMPDDLRTRALAHLGPEMKARVFLEMLDPNDLPRHYRIKLANEKNAWTDRAIISVPMAVGPELVRLGLDADSGGYSNQPWRFHPPEFFPGAGASIILREDAVTLWRAHDEAAHQAMTNGRLVSEALGADYDRAAFIRTRTAALAEIKR